MTRRFLIAALLGLALAIVPATAASAGAPLVKLTLHHINCPNTAVGAGPVSCGVFSITNLTTSPITMGDSAIDGDGGEFPLQNGCGNGVVLNPGFSCTVMVYFAPTSIGRKSIIFTPLGQGFVTLDGKVRIVGKGT